MFKSTALFPGQLGRGISGYSFWSNGRPVHGGAGEEVVLCSGEEKAGRKETMDHMQQGTCTQVELCGRTFPLGEEEWVYM